MTSSSFDSSKVVPCESTPLDRVSSGGGSVPQAKKKTSRSFVHVVVTVLLVGLGVTMYIRLSSSASSSSIVDQSVSKSVNNVIENDSIVVPTASLAASESKTSLRQVATGKSTIDTNDRRNDVSPTTSLTEVIDTPHFLKESRLTPKFPPGVFEDTPENRNNIIYIFGISGRCNDAINKSDPEVLACHLWEFASDTPSERVRMALGTIKTDADILNILVNGNIKVEDFSPLFEDYAMAVMIKTGCFSWSNGDATAHSDTYDYNSENDYSHQFSKSSSIDVSTSAGYGPITVSAGYKHAKSSSSTSSSETTTISGYKKYYATIGSIQNNCLTNKEIFQYFTKDLLKPEWTNRWKRIRDQKATSIGEIIGMGDDYEKVAAGGFFIPTMYNYEAWLTYTVSATYVTSDTSQANAASNTISAGLSLSFMGAHGSAKTQIDNAMKQSATAHHFTGTHKSSVHVDGKEIDPACLGTDTCPTQLIRAVDIIHGKGGLSKLDAHATSISTLVPLDTIIQWYFDSNTGLPDLFPDAVGEYFSYNRKGTYCWGYDYGGSHTYTATNKHNCWTYDADHIPTAIGFSKEGEPLESVGSLYLYYDYTPPGCLPSPKPKSCCNQCESVRFCDDKCRDAWRYYGGLHSLRTDACGA